MQRIRRLDLQAKISLVLGAVILPTFLIVTIAENKLTQPLLEEEVKQIGITWGKTLAAEIVSQRLLSLENPSPAVEKLMQEHLYTQPNILRADVMVKDPVTGGPRIIASNIESSQFEDDQLPGDPRLHLVEKTSAEFRIDELGVETWQLHIPIELKSQNPKGPRRVLGTVHVVASMHFVSQIMNTLWKTKVGAAAFSVVTLFLILTYFLRKTIANDRLLRKAESQNLQLTKQLHETQRQLMNSEKLAVMGQLTASFAHEIGTPLNAIGGHLQLLREELHPVGTGRLDIINSQLVRIEQIVKNFLQSTAKPRSQKQLVDLNRVADQTLGFVAPRADSLDVEIRKDFDRTIGPVRLVPSDFEQILLNLVNNSLDSLNTKTLYAREKWSRHMLEVMTRTEQAEGKTWARVSVYDTGQGINRTDLPNVMKPFFTTKPPGEGTGLGLTISQELVKKYGGKLEIESKEGTWTRVTLWFPYQANA